MRGHHDIDASQRLLEMQKKRHHRHRKKGKGKNECKPGDVLQLFYPENMVERRKDKGPGNEPCHKGIHNNLDAPINILVRKAEQLFYRPNFSVDHGYLTSSSRPI